jgi:acetoin:2,6-dichlorophenolindophenol oxidoreductase subunit alpha
VFSLPALYVCENNVYGEYTRSEDVTAGTPIDRAEAMRIPAARVDGNDLWAVREAAAAALEGVRAGDGPAFVEALTYRFVGHSRSDAGKYRPEGELDRWRERDPLVVARARLVEDGVTLDELDAIETGVAAELDAVEEAALAAPFPDPAQPATEFAT